MDNNKVTLPRDVAEAIEEYRRLHWTDASLMDISNFIDIDEYTADDDAIGNFITEAFDTNLPIYMSAILNGYTVEQTPEEKVREYYEGLMRAEDSQEIAGHSGSQFRQGWQSVRHTLELLGIKIEGINA